MSKTKKITGLILVALISLIAVWYLYQVRTAKPVDPSLMDGRKAAQEFHKLHRKK